MGIARFLHLLWYGDATKLLKVHPDRLRAMQAWLVERQDEGVSGEDLANKHSDYHRFKYYDDWQD